MVLLVKQNDEIVKQVIQCIIYTLDYQELKSCQHLLEIFAKITNIVHIQIPPTGYVGLILCSTAVATTSWSTFGSWTLCRYCDRSYRTCSSCRVPSWYPHGTVKGTLTCSSHRCSALYESYVARQEESWCVFLWHIPRYLILGLGLYGKVNFA